MTTNPGTASSEGPGVFAFICDADSRIQSPAIIPLWSAQFKDGQRFLDSGLSVKPDELRSQWNYMVRRQVSVQGQLSFLSVAGEPGRPVLYHAMPLTQREHQGKYLVVVCSGFQAPVTSTEELARSRAVLETAVDAIVTIDARGGITSINPATLRMFGYLESELIGSNVSVLMPQPYNDEHDEYISRYLRTGVPAIIGVGRQVIGRRKDGGTFPVHLAVSEFTVRDERYFTGIIRDLSELERVQNQLLQSERLAAIGQMVTGLAHESRNALQRAQAFLDMLSLDLQNHPEQLDLARRAANALQDLHRLYEEVRSYAAPIHLEFRTCDLAAIWRKEWDNLQATRRLSEIQLVEADENETIPCEVDVHRIEQVFRNVLENAIHACEGGGTITVSCRQQQTSEGPFVQICFRDNGRGLSSDVARQMFEPFFTTKQKGTGLGLAIVQRIISAHGGSITATPGQPDGAEIILQIPVHPPVRNAVRCEQPKRP